MTNKFTSLQESILVLCTLQALLYEYKKCLIKEKENPDSIIYSIITSQIILTSCSYLEEWELLGNLSTEETRILKVRKTVKPAIDRISKWKDMKLFRNSVIAHNHRIKKQNNSPVVTGITRNLNCPSSFYDYELLTGCIYITKNVLLRVFGEEYNEIVPHLKNFEGIDAINEIKDEKTYRKEFDKIISEVQNELDQYYDAKGLEDSI